MIKKRKIKTGGILILPRLMKGDGLWVNDNAGNHTLIMVPHNQSKHTDFEENTGYTGLLCYGKKEQGVRIQHLTQFNPQKL